jgi:hypothetical protein
VFTARTCAFADKTTKVASNINVLDELDKAMSIVTPRSLLDRYWGDTFLSTATSYELCSYVDSKLRQGPSSIIRKEKPLLNDAVYSSLVYARMLCRAQMVELLLRRGCDQNMKYRGRTIFGRYGFLDINCWQRFSGA